MLKKLNSILNMSTVSSSTEPILSDFFMCLNSAIKAINPRELIEKNVKIESCDKKDFLTISNDLIFPNSLLGNSSSTVNNKHSFLLDQNVYVLAFGKAALGNRFLKLKQPPKNLK